MLTSGVSNISLNSTEVQNCGQEWIGSQLSLQSSNSIDNSNSFDVMDDYCVGDINTYTPLTTIKNRPDPDIIKPNKFPTGKEAYLDAVLLKEVNRDGKAPLWLRPLAAFLEFFKIYGFGQTNCVSCATAVVDTLTHNTLHRALPDLRGAGIAGNMEKQDPNGISTKDFIEYLRNYEKQGNLYAVLAIHRPAIQRLIPGATQGHACNLIKFEGSNTFYFLDTQKRTYLSCEQSKITEKIADIRKFLGSVGAGGIDVWEGRPLDNLQKAGASSAPA
ncbi:toxin glutamine deamidase domain-containing protein [Yersinia enterocolitica]|uniref:toxin glutamine deamidase domain-containing protein n=1 Tax=Yersinia enterocolitica TaxID=630 RepID=UPI0030D5B2E9